MARLLFLHGQDSEARERAEFLTRAGHRVRFESNDGFTASQMLRKDELPDAVVIDLRRLPSHGRAVASWIRQSAKVRHLPLLFVEGDPVKTDRMRTEFRNCVFTPWSKIRGAIRSAIAHPPTLPTQSSKASKTDAAGYSGTPLAKKLGIRPESRLALIDAPADFAQIALPDLPPGVELRTRLRGNLDVIVFFAKSRLDLTRKFPPAVSCLQKGGGLWLAWPKKSSGVATDLSDSFVRETGLASGLVDNKVCAIDATWSGLRFVHRRGSAVAGDCSR